MKPDTPHHWAVQRFGEEKQMVADQSVTRESANGGGPARLTRTSWPEHDRV